MASQFETIAKKIEQHTLSSSNIENIEKILKLIKEQYAKSRRIYQIIIESDNKVENTFNVYFNMNIGGGWAPNMQLERLCTISISDVKNTSKTIEFYNVEQITLQTMLNFFYS